MTLNCYNFEFSPNFVKHRNLDECRLECTEYLLVYQGCRALTFALALLSCYNIATSPLFIKQFLCLTDGMLYSIF